MSANGVFVTGTGTGVGKTLLTACLVRGLRQKGVDAVPMKPVQTGTAEGGAMDIDVALAAAELQPDAETLAHLSPLLYAKPCSPHLAAQLEKRPIALDALLEHKQWIESRHGFVVAEGAGGLLVPLNERETMLDLARLFGYPVLVVADNALGAINHSLLTLQALAHAGLPVAGIIFTESAPVADAAINADNISIIVEMSGAKNLGCLPHVPGLDVTDLRQLDSLIGQLRLDLLVDCG